ncbi:hypothetical protein KKC17_01825 [Patescibacteria group bacterium]|nr:hypothetical protein [Patescibacteria group bacterium]
MKIGIVGYGFVGKAIKKLFSEALIYDPALPEESSSQAEINSCQVVFVCVPTNSLADGGCDTSIVEETIAWLESDLIIIRSTVKPGTTQKLIDKYPNKKIIFQPEYIGETVAHPLADESKKTFLILGGAKDNCAKAVELYQSVYNSGVKIMFLSATEAEIAKYMTNTAVANMVTLVNEYYNICQVFGADWHMVREAWLMDPRMSRYHTFVYPDKPGFSGKCLPKDLEAIAKAAKDLGYQAGFVEDILKNNDRLKKG